MSFLGRQLLHQLLGPRLLFPLYQRLPALDVVRGRPRDRADPAALALLQLQVVQKLAAPVLWKRAHGGCGQYGDGGSVGRAA